MALPALSGSSSISLRNFRHARVGGTNHFQVLDDGSAG